MTTGNSPSRLQFINLASGSNLEVGTGMKPCTTEAQAADDFALDGRAVTLVDTPGSDGTSKSDAEILKMITLFLADT